MKVTQTHESGPDHWTPEPLNLQYLPACPVPWACYKHSGQINLTECHCSVQSGPWWCLSALFQWGSMGSLGTTHKSLHELTDDSRQMCTIINCNHNKARLTVRVAAERGLSLRYFQTEVQVSCQVFEPHWWVFWKQGLTASQLLLQVPNIQLTEHRGNIMVVYWETTQLLCKDAPGLQHVTAGFEHSTVFFSLCVSVTIFMDSRAFAGFANHLNVIISPQAGSFKIISYDER